MKKKGLFVFVFFCFLIVISSCEDYTIRKSGNVDNCEISTTSPGIGYIEVLEVSGYDNAHASVVDQSDYSLSVWCYAPGISVTSGNNAGDPGVFLSLKDLYNSHVQSPTIGGNYPWYVGFGETYSCEVKGSCESDEFCLLRLSDADNTHVQSCDDSDVGAIHYSYNVCCEEEYVPQCGNNNLDAGEECDDGNLVSGDGCESDCTIPDQCNDVCTNEIGCVGFTCSSGNCRNSECTSEADCVCSTCGDGINNQDSEECDGSDLGGQSCTGLNYDEGILTCTPECIIDESSCYDYECGDGVKNQDSEECDGFDFGGQSCTGLAYDAGLLTCTSECLIDESSCYYYECGNNIVDPNGENCDGTDPTGIDYCLSINCNACLTPGNPGACTGCTGCGNGGGDDDPCTEESYYPSNCVHCSEEGMRFGYDFDGDELEDGDSTPCIANGYYLLEVYGHNLTVEQNSDCSGPSYGACYGNNLLCNYLNEEFRDCYVDITPGVPFFDWVSFLLTSLFISFYYLVDRKQKVF